ncbi:hypothetical protein PR048_010592 [Dryococelus australis]|uniref:Uncharacterized protein n=1 Tax=Dryococelus australis TaxID=614101 RepID=A0ABQ9I562_9NEOP|nr:hypothetical protein PR048_010592 [Dryococelus australis]
MWYKCHGDLVRFNFSSFGYTSAVYGVQWKDNCGPGKWPPRSPDYITTDFFLWDHAKKPPVFYHEEPRSVPDGDTLNSRMWKMWRMLPDNPNSHGYAPTWLLFKCGRRSAIKGERFDEPEIISISPERSRSPLSNSKLLVEEPAASVFNEAGSPGINCPLAYPIAADRPPAHVTKMASLTRNMAESPFANQRLVSYLPADSITDTEPFAARSSQSDNKARSQSLAHPTGGWVVPHEKNNSISQKTVRAASERSERWMTAAGGPTLEDGGSVSGGGRNEPRGRAGMRRTRSRNCLRAQPTAGWTTCDHSLQATAPPRRFAPGLALRSCWPAGGREYNRSRMTCSKVDELMVGTLHQKTKLILDTSTDTCTELCYKLFKIRNYFPSIVTNFTGRTSLSVPIEIHAGRSSDFSKVDFKRAHLNLNSSYALSTYKTTGLQSQCNGSIGKLPYRCLTSGPRLTRSPRFAALEDRVRIQVFTGVLAPSHTSLTLGTKLDKSEQAVPKLMAGIEIRRHTCAVSNSVLLFFFFLPIARSVTSVPYEVHRPAQRGAVNNLLAQGCRPFWRVVHGRPANRPPPLSRRADECTETKCPRRAVLVDVDPRSSGVVLRSACVGEGGTSSKCLPLKTRPYVCVYTRRAFFVAHTSSFPPWRLPNDLLARSPLDDIVCIPLKKNEEKNIYPALPFPAFSHSNYPHPNFDFFFPRSLFHSLVSRYPFLAACGAAEKERIEREGERKRRNKEDGRVAPPLLIFDVLRVTDAHIRGACAERFCAAAVTIPVFLNLGRIQIWRASPTLPERCERYQLESQYPDESDTTQIYGQTNYYYKAGQTTKANQNNRQRDDENEDTTQIALAQSSSPATVTAANLCAFDIGIFVHKTVESSLQVTELAKFSGLGVLDVILRRTEPPVKYERTFGWKTVNSALHWLAAGQYGKTGVVLTSRIALSDNRDNYNTVFLQRNTSYIGLCVPTHYSSSGDQNDLLCSTTFIIGWSSATEALS